MQDIIVMCPTVERARIEFNRFCHFYDSIITKKKLCEVTLVNRQKIMFRGETEGQRVLRGTRADIISIDEFTTGMNGEDKNDE